MHTHNYSVSDTSPELVLASASPRRKELLTMLLQQQPFCLLPTDSDERLLPEWTPEQAVQQLALRKARAAAEQLQHLAEQQQHEVANDARSVVIGADTLVVCDGRMLGKPADAHKAAAMLLQLQGRSHEVYTGVACLNLKASNVELELVLHRKTQVWMKPLTKERIASYIATGEPMDKAGAYAIQGIGGAFIERIDGCYYNVVGLPLSLLADMLEQCGVKV